MLSFFLIKPFLLAVFLGALLAYVFYPLYRYLLNKSGNKTLSSLMVSILVFLVLMIPLGLIIKMLIQESYSLYLLVKEKLAVGLFENCSNLFCMNIKTFFQSNLISSQIGEVTKAFTEWIIKKSSSLLMTLPKLLINLFIIFFTMFFFMKDSDALMKKIRAIFSDHKKNYSHLINRLKEILHGVVFGYLLVALIQGTLGALGFFIFGISSPLFWGMVMSLLALIPLLGTGVVWLPASLILILEGVFQNSTLLIFKGLGLLVYSFFIVGGIDNLIKPKLIGGKARVHTAIIMLGIFGGLVVLGPLGVIIGPLVLAFTLEIFELYALKKT